MNSGDVVMERFHGTTANAGQDFQVQVRISSSAGDLIKAMGLRETLPDGWTFTGLTGVTGDVPAVAPPPGSAGMLEFAWITIPQFPYTFSYTVHVPEDDAGGNHVLHGQLEYRLDGPAQYAAPVITNVAGGKDTQPPVITLQGGQSINLQQGQGWSEPGFAARDNVDGDITSRVQVSGDVNPSVVSTYVLTYTVSDAAGNTGRAQRTVRVVGSGNGGGTGTPSRPSGGGVGTGGGTVGGGSGGGIVGGVPDGMVDDGAAGTTQPKSTNNPAAEKAANNTPTIPAGAQPIKKINHPENPTGTMELRPPVQPGQAPAPADAAAPGAVPPAPNAGGQGIRTINHPAQSGDGAAGESGAVGDSPKLSDAWPQLDATKPVEVAKLDAAADPNAAAVEPARFGPQSGAGNLAVIVGVSALCVAGLAGSVMAARSVYGGRRRRVAAPPKA